MMTLVGIDVEKQAEVYRLITGVKQPTRRF